MDSTNPFSLAAVALDASTNTRYLLGWIAGFNLMRLVPFTVLASATENPIRFHLRGTLWQLMLIPAAWLSQRSLVASLSVLGARFYLSLIEPNPLLRSALWYAGLISFYHAIRVATVQREFFEKRTLAFKTMFISELCDIRKGRLLKTREDWRKAILRHVTELSVSGIVYLASGHLWESFISSKNHQLATSLLGKTRNLLVGNLIVLFRFLSVLFLGDTTERAIGLFNGFESPSNYDHILQSQSLVEFWRRRWNLEMHETLKELVYKPALRKGYSKSTAIASAFAASAVHHLWIFPLAYGGFNKSMLLGVVESSGFFAMQVCLILLEVKFRLKSHFWFLTSLFASGQLLTSSFIRSFVFPNTPPASRP